MPNRPIIFTDWQVWAAQEKRLTQIRVPIKWQPYHEDEKINFGFSGLSLGNYCTGVPESGYVLYSRGHGGCWNQRTKPVHAPFQPGDLLYARETWCNINKPEYPPDYYYLADCLGSAVEDYDPSEWTWRSPATMPREAARLFLPVGEVRVQKLGEMTEEDAKATGVIPHGDNAKPHIKTFYSLWQRMYAKRGYGWDSNPWTFVAAIKA